MKLSVAITNYNRFDTTVKSIQDLLDDSRIDDFVILDDCSTDGSYERLRMHYDLNDKVQVALQPKNRGMAQNKADAIALSKNDYVLIGDSDNIFDKSFIDSFFEWIDIVGIETNDTIFCPDFAKPNFNYTAYAGLLLSRYSIKDFLGQSDMSCLLNTANYIVPKQEYLRVFQPNPDVKGCDTIWFNYLWLSNYNLLQVVPGMQYIHTLSDDSEFKKEMDYNMRHAAQIEQMIKDLE